MSVEIFDRDGAKLNAQFLGFAGGERHIQLDPDRVHKIPAPRILTLRAALTSSDAVFDLILACDALLRIDNALRFQIELPYLPYARQDRVCAPGQAFSLDAFVRLIGTIGNIDQIVVWDCHSQAGLELTRAINVEPAEIIARNAELTALIKAPGSVLICPDKGAIGRTRAIAEAFDTAAIAYADKARNPRTGEIANIVLDGTPLEGKTAIITDDICDGGYTFTLLAKALRERGVARIILYVTHGIFSRGFEVFDGLIDKIYASDSFDGRDANILTTIRFQYPF